MSAIDKAMGMAHEDMDHLIWHASTCNGHPAMRMGDKTVLVRRAIWQELHGDIPAGKIIRVTCGDVLCIAPNHMMLTDYSRLAKSLGSAVMAGPVRSAAIARAKQAKALVINHDIVREIRTSNLTGVQLSKKHSISQNLVSKVRLHKCWKDWTNNPFMGLGVRA